MIWHLKSKKWKCNRQANKVKNKRGDRKMIKLKRNKENVWQFKLKDVKAWLEKISNDPKSIDTIGDIFRKPLYS